MARSIAALALLALLAACDGGARGVDYPPGRGISADIDASHFRGPGSLYPGMTEAGEPLGVFPWQLDEHHQSER
jgi:hypothetical protein